jgi:hypothetical protein
VYRRDIDAVAISFQSDGIDVSIEDRPDVENALVDVWRDLKER